MRDLEELGRLPGSRARLGISGSWVVNVTRTLANGARVLDNLDARATQPRSREIYDGLARPSHTPYGCRRQTTSASPVTFAVRRYGLSASDVAGRGSRYRKHVTVTRSLILQAFPKHTGESDRKCSNSVDKCSSYGDSPYHPVRWTDAAAGHK
jgi:hypothetical protein